VRLLGVRSTWTTRGASQQTEMVRTRYGEYTPESIRVSSERRGPKGNTGDTVACAGKTWTPTRTPDDTAPSSGSGAVPRMLPPMEITWVVLSQHQSPLNYVLSSGTILILLQIGDIEPGEEWVHSKWNVVTPIQCRWRRLGILVCLEISISIVLVGRPGTTRHYLR
jgi:hypothetical protein